MELTGQEYKRLTKALTKAFPTEEKLERLLKFQLDKSLAEIAQKGNLNDMVYEVIGAAQAEGWLGSLINGAKEENPDSPFLRNLKEQPSKKVTDRIFVRQYLNFTSVLLSVVVLVVLGAILQGRPTDPANTSKNNNSNINIDGHVIDSTIKVGAEYRLGW